MSKRLDMVASGRFGLPTRLISALLVLCSLSESASAIADAEVCRENAASAGQLRSEDLQRAFLRRDPSVGGVAALFAAAEGDPALRKILNEKIAADSELRDAAALGTRFRAAFLDLVSKASAGGPADPRTILYPRRRLLDLFRDFKNRQRNFRDRPLREYEADLRAREDVVAMYGIEPDFSEASLQYDPQRDDILRVYRDQRRRREFSGEVREIALGNTDLSRFYGWLKKTYDYYQTQRAKNLLQALEGIARYSRTGLSFRMGSQTIAIRPEAYAGIVGRVGESDEGVSLTVREGRLRYSDRKERWWRFWEWYRTYPRAARIARAVAKEGAPGDLYFTLSSVGADGEDRKASFRVSLNDLYRLLSSYSTKLGVSTLEGATNLSDLLQFAFAYERNLAAIAGELKAWLGGPNPEGFAAAVLAGAQGERSAGDGIQSLAPTGDLFQRSRRLFADQPPDGVTGIEWWGYRIAPDYWNRRDSGFPPVADPRSVKAADLRTKENLAQGLVRGVRERVAKTKKLVKDVVLTVSLTVVGLGAVVGGLVAVARNAQQGTEIAQAEKAKAAIRLSKPEAKGTPEGQSESDLFSVWRTGPAAEKPPRYFDFATVDDLAEKSKWVEVSGRNGSFFSGAEDTARETIHFSSVAPLLATEGYLLLPRPEGFELIRDRLFVTSRNGGFANLARKVFRNPRTGQYLIQVAPPASVGEGDAGYDVSASFQRIPSLSIENLAFDDPRFHNLDTARLAVIGDRIRAAGLVHLADAWSARLQTDAPVSVDDLAELIGGSEIYSLNPGVDLAPADSANLFERFRPFLRGGRLYMKCDIAYELLATILREQFADQPDILVEALPSYVLTPTDRNGSGVLTSIGHLRVALRISGRSGQKALDPTPKTPEESPDPAKKSPPAGWPEATPVRRRQEGVEADGVGEETRPSEDAHQGIEALAYQAREVLANASFRVLVRRTTEVLPAQRIYILARNVLYYAVAQIDAAALLAKMRELYPSLEFAPFQGNAEFVAAIRRIEAYETDQWKKFEDLARRNARGAAARDPVYGAASDPGLKALVFGLLETLRRYVWRP